MMESTYKQGTLVKADNKLVTSHYSLSVEEQRLIFHLASSIRVNDNNFTEYQFTLGKLREIVGKNITMEEADALGLQLMKRVLRFDSENGDRMSLAHWISTFSRIRSKELFSIKLHQEMQPLLIELRERFTEIPLLHVCHLRSGYAVRLYMLLCESRNREEKQFRISIDQLRKMFEIPSKEYKAGCDFKKRVIVEPVAEINEQADFYVEVKDIRQGGRSRGRLLGFEFNFLSENLLRDGRQPMVSTKKNRKNSVKLLSPEPKEISDEERAANLEQFRRTKKEIFELKLCKN